MTEAENNATRVLVLTFYQAKESKKKSQEALENLFGESWTIIKEKIKTIVETETDEKTDKEMWSWWINGVRKYLKQGFRGKRKE